MEKYRLNRHLLCIDLKSFYASVECVLAGYDPFTTPLVVADKARGNGSIVLSVTPFLKAMGVSSRCRVYELPTDVAIIYAKPKMHTYLEYSAKIISIYLDFISEDDLYIYSVDEAFLDVTSYLAYYQCSDEDLGRRILKTLRDRLGLYATCGIGPNMLMAKLAMDIDAKHASDFIAKWTYDDLKDRLWPVKPLSKMWGIGYRMEHHLNVLGMHTIGDIASSNPQFLKDQFGILGEELYYHTHGIDMSLVQDKYQMKSVRKSFGLGQVLFRDYSSDEIILIIEEMVDEVTRRLRIAKKQTKCIALSIGYAKEFGGGFSRQLTLTESTSSVRAIYEVCLRLFEMYDEGLPIRRVGIALSSLSTKTHYQYSIFEDVDALAREETILSVIDNIKMRHGKNSINRASSELEHSTEKRRNESIGGHHV